MSEIFSSASTAWHGMERYRADRARCKRYIYGDQWEDMIETSSGRMTERRYIRSQGQEPLRNNLLRRILRNVTGLYRAQYKVPLLTRSSGLKGRALREANARIRRRFEENNMEEFSSRLLEEFLISGLVAVKVGGRDILPVTPDNFFFHSDGYDPRGRDVDLIGEVHRVGYGSILERFCHSAEEYRRIAEAYGAAARGADGCRLLEVWSKETMVFALSHDEDAASLRLFPLTPLTPINSLTPVNPINSPNSINPAPPSSAIMTRTVWRCRWYASDGTLLRKGDPVADHPYVFKAYPFIDGEMHSYVSDIIDQQRYVNRLITLYDFIMRSSAKGVLLIPEESIPRGMDIMDMAQEWGRFNGVIPYRARPGVPMPAQVSANSTNIGITELLKIEMQMLEDISGVSPTLQGKLQTNSTSGTLFAQQNEAAQTSLLDIIRTFSDFIRQLGLKGHTDGRCGS